jgi:hypothetical protein
MKGFEIAKAVREELARRGYSTEVDDSTAGLMVVWLNQPSDGYWINCQAFDNEEYGDVTTAQINNIATRILSAFDEPESVIVNSTEGGL